MRRVLATLGVALMYVALWTAMPVQTKPQPSSAAPATFDHSNCQYPDRWTNPPNGCDNSDPAVPECIKAFSTEQGEKDCIAAFVAQHQEPVPSVTSTQPQAAQCGGK